CLGDKVSCVGTRAEFDALTGARPIVLVTVDDRSLRISKHVLQGLDYLRFIGACDFFLAPPGCAMPLSHNLIEAMSLGAIPILNYGDYLDPPLRDGVDCLAFSTI